MLGRAADSIFCGRIVPLALLLATLGLSPALCAGDEAGDPKPLATFPMGPDRMPFVTLSFGGKDYQCLLDTGSAGTWLDKRLLAELGPPDGSLEGRDFYVLPSVSIGGLQMSSGMIALSAELDALAEASGRPMRGIIGMNILRKYAVSLNFDDAVVSLREPQFRPDSQGIDGAVKIECLPCPHVLVDFAGHDALALVDTGSESETHLRQDLVDDLCDGNHAVTLGRMVIRAFSHNHNSRWGLLAWARMNGVRHEQLLWSDLQHNERAGNLGTLFLARYNSTLRFAQNELVLSKSKWHDAQFCLIYAA